MNTSTPTFLFAGPDLASTRQARLRLRQRGGRVLLAADPEEALRRAVDDAPDVLVLDEDARSPWPGDWLDRLLALRPDADVAVLQAPGAPRSPRPALFFAAPKPMPTGILVDALSARFPGRLSKGGEAPAIRILCVDDDPRWLRSLERSLARWGYAVQGYENARDALDSVKRSAPGAAIVDILMPDMDGLALTEEIGRATGGRVPVVCLTALDTSEAWHEAKRRGARYFLSKTGDPERLVDVMDYLTADLDESERLLIRPRL